MKYDMVPINRIQLQHEFVQFAQFAEPDCIEIPGIRILSVCFIVFVF